MLLLEGRLEPASAAPDDVDASSELDGTVRFMLVGRRKDCCPFGVLIGGEKTGARDGDACTLRADGPAS